MILISPHAQIPPCAGVHAHFSVALQSLAVQEWNEIQYNGVYYEPALKGAPGEIDPEKSYTFKYPRPARWGPGCGNVCWAWGYWPDMGLQHLSTRAPPGGGQGVGMWVGLRGYFDLIWGCSIIKCASQPTISRT